MDIRYNDNDTTILLYYIMSINVWSINDCVLFTSYDTLKPYGALQECATTYFESRAWNRSRKSKPDVLITITINLGDAFVGGDSRAGDGQVHKRTEVFSTSNDRNLMLSSSQWRHLSCISFAVPMTCNSRPMSGQVHFFVGIVNVQQVSYMCTGNALGWRVLYLF